MASQLRLHLLGPPQVNLDGQRVTAFKSVKVQAVLFYVAVARRPRSRPELAALLWPEVSEKQANTSLRAALSNLRRLVGEHLEITRQTVALNPGSNTVLDIAQFDTLLKRGVGEAPDILQVETAVSLYAGDFLEGFQVPDAPLFEQWVTTEGTRLRGALLGALHTLALWHAERAEYQTSLDYLARLLALDPIREVGHRLKMAVLALTGQRGAALTYYDFSRRIRSEQLGLDPTPETVALYELILHDRFPGKGQPAISELIADTQSRGLDSSVVSAPERPKIFRQEPSRKTANVDWGDMPARVDFYGRQNQLDRLVNWLAAGRCRLVTILGIGGVGKTTLAAELARRLADLSSEDFPGNILPEETPQAGAPIFDQIIWRSLVNAPPLRVILNDWLQALPDQPVKELPESLDARLDLLFQELRRRRCLLILDNAESILRGREQAGQTKAGYEDYLQLIQQMAKKEHQSCLLLTSREAPRGLRRLSEDYDGVEFLQLDGLPVATGVDFLRSRGLQSPQDRLMATAEHYSGNPLALKLVADTVRELFSGDIEAFFHDEAPVFADIRDVLEQQFERLSGLEQEIVTWLAIERQPVPARVLWDDLAPMPHRRQFVEALRSLQRRSLLEQSPGSGVGDESRFALQNVVMEYATSRLVESVCQELDRGELELLQRHALVKAHTREYIEHSQRRLLLRPVAVWLVARLGLVGAILRLRHLLETIHDRAPRAPGYAGANTLHLLLEMGEDLSGYDFSDLAIWQADLRDTSLFDVSFRGTDLKGSLFRDTFGLVITVAISPDGQSLAAGSSDGSITLWRLNEYQPNHILKQHTGFVSSVVFSPDGRLLASASSDHTILLWDVHSGQLICQLSGHNALVFAVTFSPDGKTLFSGGEDQIIGIWDVQRGQMRGQLSEQGINFMAVATSPDGQILAGGAQTGMVCFWDANAGELRSRIHGHDGKVRAVAFSPDGATLATAGEDKKIHLWHTQDGAPISTLTGHDNWVLSIAFSPDGSSLASGSADRTVHLWDIQSGRTIRVLRGYKNWVTSVAFSPEGELVAGGSYDRRIRLWDTRSGRLVHILRGSLRWVDRVIFSPDGKLLASASFDKPLLLWDVESGQLFQRLQGHEGSIRCFAFSPDGQILAGGSDDHTVRLWETGNGNLRRTLTGHEGFVRTLTFSPDGQSLATGDMKGNLRVWEVSTGRQQFAWTDVILGVKYSICFSPDGQLLAYGCGNHTIRLIDPNTGHEQASLTGYQAPVQLIRFSPDGSLLASRAKDGAIRVWKMAANADGAWQPYLRWSVSNEELWNLVFSPDGRFLAAQLDESTVGLWDLSDGRLHCSIEQYLMAEGCLAFSQDGALLITGSIEGLVSLWNTSSGELFNRMEGHLESVTSLAVNPVVNQLASSSGDGTIRLWDIQTGAKVRVMTPPGPYAGMDISGATGLTAAQAAALQALGAVDDHQLQRL